jgi:hypothetical protein
MIDRRGDSQLITPGKTYNSLLASPDLLVESQLGS